MTAIKILLVEDDEDDYTLTKELLAEVEGQEYDLVWAPTYEAAIFEIRRGTYDVFLVDYRLGRRSGLDLLCGELQEGRLGPVFILSGMDAREVDVEAMKHGASGYLVKHELRATHLARTLRYAIEGFQAKGAETGSGVEAGPTPKRGRSVALIGSKGGTGTTTIVANVASALSNRGLSVVAVEMRGNYGDLTRLVNIAPAKDIAGLLTLEPGQITKEAFESRLSRQLNGLRVLAAPQSPFEYGQFSAAQASAILDVSTRCADLVLYDLPCDASPATREILLKADLVAMVVEREASSIASARMMMSSFHAWEVRVPIGSVITSRGPLPDAMSATDINAQLGLKKYGIIPSAPELFHKGAVQLQPIIVEHPSHPVGKALDELALFLLLVR